MADFELADNADAEGREFITRYEADCVSEGDHRPKRIAGMMSFREERGSLGSRRWALGENTLLADAETPSAAPNANDAIDNTYSDAPACNALTHRIAEEVLPCLQRVKPELAQHLQVAIGDRQHAPRLRSDLAESADVLSQVEEECQTHWQQVLHQLDSKAAEGECLLKD